MFVERALLFVPCFKVQFLLSVLELCPSLVCAFILIA